MNEGEEVPSPVWETVLRILERRSHTRRELIRKLRQRGHGPETAEAAADKAERLSLMGDEAGMACRYAQSLAQRANATPPSVRAKLQARGFDAGDVDTAVRQAFEGWQPRDAARRLLEKEQDLDRGARRLLRRGFPAEEVRAAARSLRRERADREA